MLNFKKIIHSSSPFSWFVLDNVLDEDEFYEIKDEVRHIFDNTSKIDHVLAHEPTRTDANFKPGISNLIGGNLPNKTSADIVINQAKNGGRLEKLCKGFLDKETQKTLYRTLVPISIFDLKSLRPLKIHSKLYKISIFDYIFFKNCYVNLKLSSYTSNFGLAQHKDHGDKVTALLFYFGFTDDVLRNSYSTQLFEVTEGNYQWSKKIANSTLDYYEEKKLNLVHEVNSLPNRLFGFRKTKHSWHAVEPSHLPPGVRREVLQVNLMNHYNSSKNLEILRLLINSVKSLIRPILKRALGYK